MTRLNSRDPSWWTDERRAEASERSRRAWRERHPEKASIRDEILRGVEPAPCRCGATEVTLFVTDYEQRLFVWRCRPCAEAMRQSTTTSAATSDEFVLP